MKTINSLQNETVKHIVKLQNTAYRKEHRQFIAQGHSVCSTLIKHGYQAQQIYITEQAYAKYDCKFNDITIVSDHVMEKISTTTTASGVLGVFMIPTASYEPTTNALVLYNIQDPGNMGTLIRTAAAMNTKNIFIIEGVDPYSPKVIQATAGTIAYVIIIPTDWKTFLTQHATIKTCALVVEHGKNPKQLDISESILVIGNEGQGLPNDVIKACNQQLTIPMPGKTESLNAAVAGSIALYEKHESVLIAQGSKIRNL